MRRLIFLSFSALALVGATASAAVAERPAVPSSVCGAACDGGGGVVAGGWCPTVGTYAVAQPGNVVVRCSSAHTWLYA